jgi:hypothetical protein
MARLDWIEEHIIQITQASADRILAINDKKPG